MSGNAPMAALAIALATHNCAGAVAEAHRTKASFYWQPQKQACPGYGRFDPDKLTAAHRTLPCGSRVEVTNPKNKKSVVVTITDRGPFIAGRDLDLSKAAARRIGIIAVGVAPVVYRVIADEPISDIPDMGAEAGAGDSFEMRFHGCTKC